MSKRKQEEGIKIVFTGGHAATTAIAVIDEIHTDGLPWKLYWIGAKYAVEGKKITTLEFQELPHHGAIFLPLIMGRIQRRLTVWTVPSLFKIPVGFVQALYYLIKLRPEVVLSFGGFSSYPVVFASRILSIPVVIHEQTAAAGRANQAGAAFADKIALSRLESQKYFPAQKTIITGNPVSKKMFEVKPKTKLQATPVIFITGGSRGSQNLNNVIETVLPELLKKYTVIHQTGKLDINKFENIQKGLAKEVDKRYQVFSVVAPDEIVSFYEKADLIVSRAGANTVSEILAAKRPAILIPLPISYLDEQTKNAEILEAAGFGKIINQAELTGDLLVGTIENIFSNYKKYLNAINKFESPDAGASGKIVGLLKEYVK